MIATHTSTGSSVLLTRSREDSEAWARRLAACGVRGVVLPCISVDWFDSTQLRAQLAQAAQEQDWIVFTSRRGVEAFHHLLGSHSDNMRAWPADTRIAAVGSATASVCEHLLGRVDLVSSEDTASAGGGTAAALADALLDPARAGDRVGSAVSAGSRLLLVLADNAGTLLERRLREAGAEVTRIAVYRTIPAPARQPRKPLSSLGTDRIFLASPSAVTGLVNQVDFDCDAGVFTIGPSTSERARQAGLTVTREAREPSLEGLLEAMQWKS